jgi:hypothetical protein
MPAAVRTTIMLHADSRRAAKELAAKLDVSPSEVIRRALVHYRDELMGTPSRAERIRRRLAALERASEVFKNVDPAAEMRRIRRERGDW